MDRRGFLATAAGMLGGAAMSSPGFNFPMFLGSGNRGKKPTGPRVLFEENFSGTFSRWNSCQWNAGGSIRNSHCNTYDGTSDYSAAIANGGTGHESCARFELRDGDIPFGGTERAEIAYPGGETIGDPGTVRPGEERIIEWDMRFNSDWPTHPGSWCVIWQWHPATGVGSPSVCLDIGDDDIIYLANNNAADYTRTSVGAPTLNVWQHWKIHVRFHWLSTIGFAQLWIDDTEILAKHSRVTMILDETFNYFKCGIYRDPVNTATAILWYDNIKITAP